MSEEIKNEIEKFIDRLEERLGKTNIDQETYEFEDQIYDFLGYLLSLEN